ncbi:MAG TPA: ribonuclease HII, partial [Bacilli bacterium]|nr:ribonuclease HII [Bacilli bacterium]
MSKLSIKEIEAQFFSEVSIDEAILEQLRTDTRKGVINLLEKYDRQKQRAEQERLQFYDKLKFENELRNKGIKLIAGIDEVGRGPLAGPVVASAVILSDDFFLPGLTDSKKLSNQQRERFYEEITNQAQMVSVHFLSAAEIDRLNIYQATKKAMIHAVESLSVQPEHLLIDAMELPLSIQQTSIVKGDLKSASIAADLLQSMFVELKAVIPSRQLIDVLVVLKVTQL